MKKNKIILVYLFFIIVVAFSSDLDDDGFKGQVKTVTKKIYSFENGARKYYTTEIYKYDNQGRKIFKTDEFSNPRYKEEVTYKENQKIINGTYKNNRGEYDNSLIYKQVVKYNDNDQVLVYDGFFRDELVEKTIKEYNENNKIIKSVYYNENGDLKEKNIYKYDEKGNKIEFIQYNLYEDVEKHYIYTYNENNKLIIKKGKKDITADEYNLYEDDKIVLKRVRSKDLLEFNYSSRSFKYIRYFYDESNKLKQKVFFSNVNHFDEWDSDETYEEFKQLLNLDKYITNDNKTYFITDYIYNNSGQKIEEIYQRLYGENDYLQEKIHTLYEYDKKDLLKKIKKYQYTYSNDIEKKELIVQKEWKNDEKDNVIEFIYFNKDDNEHYKLVKEYDKYNNVVKNVKYYIQEKFGEQTLSGVYEEIYEISYW